MKEAIKDLINEIEIVKDDVPHFNKVGYKSFGISKDNFKSMKHIDSDKKICFVDGGNQEIIGAHNFSFQLIRGYCSVYQKNKKIYSKVFESFVLISTKNISGKLFFVSKFFPIKDSVKLSPFEFDIYDSTMSTGSSGVKIESVGDAIRRFYELNIARFVCEKKLADAIILDGSLEITISGEKDEMEKLYLSSVKNDVSIFALSKTSSMLTTSGKSLIGLLNSIGPKDSWYYHPIVEIKNDSQKSEIYVIKLHPKSNYVFKFEKYNKSKLEIDEMLSILSLNSRDAVFLGYPYGLIDADKQARVQNREIEMQKMKLFSSIGKDFEKIRYTLNSKNAHSILDNIS